MQKQLCNGGKALRSASREGPTTVVEQESLPGNTDLLVSMGGHAGRFLAVMASGSVW
jgi:hypothetical protein